MKYTLEHGHTVTIEEANRGIDDDYLISFYEDGRLLFKEYGSAEYIEDQYDITI